MKIFFTFVIFSSFISFNCSAQDDAFSRDIMKIQETNGSSATSDAVYRQIVLQMKMQMLNELLASIYKKYFTHEEVIELFAFYESAIGKKLTEKSPGYLLRIDANIATMGNGPDKRSSEVFS